MRRTGDPEAGADITAETFAVAMLQADRYRPERGPALGWLLGIARHKILMLERTGRVERRARQRLGIAPIELSDEGLERVERLASLEVRTEVLEEALASLPAAQRASLVARVVDEQSYDAIAAAAQVSEPVVRQRVSRALTTLRVRMRGSE